MNRSVRDRNLEKLLPSNPGDSSRVVAASGKKYTILSCLLSTLLICPPAMGARPLGTLPPPLPVLANPQPDDGVNGQLYESKCVPNYVGKIAELGTGTVTSSVVQGNYYEDYVLWRCRAEEAYAYAKYYYGAARLGLTVQSAIIEEAKRERNRAEEAEEDLATQQVVAVILIAAVGILAGVGGLVAGSQIGK